MISVTLISEEENTLDWLIIMMLLISLCSQFIFYSGNQIHCEHAITNKFIQFKINWFNFNFFAALN